MSGLATVPMRSLLDDMRKFKHSANDDAIWSLNLDQIESHSGKVLNKRVVKTADLGPSTYAFEKGTVLYSKLRPYLNKVVVADEDGMATTELVPLRCDESQVMPKYLAHFLRSSDFLGFATNVVAGAKMPRMVMGEFWAYPVPLPPLAEQRRIAAILDQAETLRCQRRVALAQLDSLTQSILFDMFGDPAVEESKWSKTRLEQVAELVTGYPFRSEEYVGLNEGIKLCRGANVLPGRLDWRDMACWPHAKVKEAEAFHLQAGDIVMAMDRPWISEGFKLAQVAAIDCPMLLVQRVARIRPKSDVTNEYLFAVLSHLAFTRHCKPTETTIPHISPKDIRTFAFPLPPLPLQQIFATRIQAIESLKTIHRTALAELDALFASLQQRAFAGEL